MSQKETIVNMLKTNGTMTQGALAEAIYGDKNHGPNIYATLIGLVKNGAVLRTGSTPSYYSLSGTEILIPEKSQKSTKGYRDVSGDIITNEAMEEAETLVQGTDNYGPENELITRCLRKFPKNTDPDIVAMKVGLIDITNSTHLSQHKSKISMVELANIIAATSIGHLNIFCKAIENIITAIGIAKNINKKVFIIFSPSSRSFLYIL